MKHMLLSAAILTAAAGLFAGAAQAQQAGSMSFGIGLAGVMPKNDNGSVANGAFGVHVGDNVQPTATFEYFIKDNIGIEILAATPFTHKANLNGVKAADVQHLPPTVSLQYHVPTTTGFTPFFGVGVTYAKVLDVDTTGPLAGANLELDDSWGVAFHAGVDYALANGNALRMDLRWMDIDLDAKLNGADIGTVEVDPVVVGVAYVLNF